MNISALYVTTSADFLQETQNKINSLIWAEVYFSDEKGRMIVIVEGENTEIEISRLKEIKELPGVYSAELSYHYFEEEALEISKTVGMENEFISEYLNSDLAENPKSSFYQTLKNLSNY